MFLFRPKVLVPLLILAVVIILFWQNQERLALKFLCRDPQQFCFYQTPALPVIVWMVLFAIAGILTSLLWQLLNSVSASPSPSRNADVYSDTNFTPPNPPIPNSPINERRSPNISLEKTERAASGGANSDWEEDRSEDWGTVDFPTSVAEAQDRQISSPNYEAEQTPTTVERSGSVYSYKYKEATPKDKDKDIDKDFNKEERIYDANFKVVNPPQTQSGASDRTEEEEEEEWI